jgi:molybdate transport system substrate-binding protein
MTGSPPAARRAAALLFLGLTACTASPAGTPTPAPSVEAFELTIFGAASLTDALARIETTYEAEVPGADLVIATDSSAALRTQIEEGAPADVFLGADTSNVRALAQAGLCSDSRSVPFAGNSLALVVPSTNPGGIASPADLARPGVAIIAAGPEVPITRYAAQVVADLARLPGYPADFADRYAANVVSEEDNVRGVLAKIELSEGDAGFVYVTDGLASELVVPVEIPPQANAHAIYAGCAIAESPRLGDAEAFMDWLTGPDGQRILDRFGFAEWSAGS